MKPKPHWKRCICGPQDGEVGGWTTPGGLTGGLLSEIPRKDNPKEGLGIETTSKLVFLWSYGENPQGESCTVDLCEKKTSEFLEEIAHKKGSHAFGHFIL